MSRRRKHVSFELLSPFSDTVIGRVYLDEETGSTRVKLKTILARMTEPCLELYGIHVALDVETVDIKNIPKYVIGETRLPPDRAAEAVKICIAHATKRVIRVKPTEKIYRVRVEKQEKRTTTDMQAVTVETLS